MFCYFVVGLFLLDGNLVKGGWKVLWSFNREFMLFYRVILVRKFRDYSVLFGNGLWNLGIL